MAAGTQYTWYTPLRCTVGDGWADFSYVCIFTPVFFVRTISVARKLRRLQMKIWDNTWGEGKGESDVFHRIVMRSQLTT